MKKWLIPLTVATFCLAACDDKNNTQANVQKTATPNEQPQKNAEMLPLVTVVAPWELNSLDLNQSGVIFQRMNLAETLVEANSDGQLVAGLATQWESNADATVWTFSLRNATFHNGKPLNAQAVEKSLKIAHSKPGVLQKAFIKDIKALDANKVQFELTQPFVPFPSFLTHYTTLILAEESFDAQGNVTEVIGTGAFKATKIEAPQKLETVRFEGYWGSKPQLQQANYLASSRSETRTLMAQSDATSLVFNLDKASVARLKTDPNLQLINTSIARTMQLKMDLAKPFFNDLTIRQALSQAINRKAIAEQILKIQDGMADQILPKSFADWRVETKETTLSHEEVIAKIKENLTASGYQYNAEGKLTKDGKPFSFTLRTYSDRPELPITATILQAEWKKIGIDVNVSVGNFSEIPSGHQDGTLEMALYSFNYAKTLDPFALIVQDYANGGSDWGVMNWRNETLENSLKQIEVERDPQKNKQLKQQVSQIIYDELPIIPIVYDQQTVVAHKGINGLMLDPFERRFYLEKLSK
ncbi:ABC transporter substrate-binding protein [Mannheimia granulomatis]|uniref:ABC transporter substrate-binding protein n=1 Tax=Mannheimia granulomatis TaxID=85402 RepID=UPI00159EA9A0|nr:ABC transporter substrate-binding protein [Mannheimia granulomatis]QLB15433.1 ABC transporter substrate-binding protein [Mannheimia granulomatis]